MLRFPPYFVYFLRFSHLFCLCFDSDLAYHLPRRRRIIPPVTRRKY